MPTLEDAKKLLKKAMTIGDSELIDMAYKMIEQATNNVEVKDIDTYFCSNCSHSVPSEKPIKKCPKCKKHKLTKVEPLVEKTKEEPQRDPMDFSVKRNENTNKIKFKYDENGNKVGSYGRTEPINVGKNTFIDDGSECMADKEFDKKIVRPPASPRRPPPKLIEVKCEDCKQVFKKTGIVSKNYYICDRCGSRRRG